MPAAEPMLAATAAQWPAGEGWLMQPKWDGFRLLVEVTTDGSVRAWTRRGVSLSAHLGTLLEPFSAAAGSVFDGELVALADRDGRVVQDFAAAGRAALHGDAAAAAQLHYVAFDLLKLAGRDLRTLALVDREDRLAEALPRAARLHRVTSQPESLREHEAIVALGFEGTVLKRPGSAYRPGWQRTWLKHEARRSAPGTVVHAATGRDGRR